MLKDLCKSDKYEANAYYSWCISFSLVQGRYDLHQPIYRCQTCQQQWSPDLRDLIRSGYWPASVAMCTLYTLDLLSTFQELKVISPGFSRQAFAKLLEHRTKCGGRVSLIFFWYSLCSISRHKGHSTVYVHTDWLCQRRCPATQLPWIFLYIIWGRPAVLWNQLHLSSMHTWNVGCFSWWQQKAISLSTKRKVLFVEVIWFCVCLHLIMHTFHG